MNAYYLKVKNFVNIKLMDVLIEIRMIVYNVPIHSIKFTL